jgi:hypothetical protein
MLLENSTVLGARRPALPTLLVEWRYRRQYIVCPRTRFLPTKIIPLRRAYQLLASKAMTHTNRRVGIACMRSRESRPPGRTRE